MILCPQNMRGPKAIKGSHITSVRRIYPGADLPVLPACCGVLGSLVSKPEPTRAAHLQAQPPWLHRSGRKSSAMASLSGCFERPLRVSIHPSPAQIPGRLARRRTDTPSALSASSGLPLLARILTGSRIVRVLVNHPKAYEGVLC